MLQDSKATDSTILDYELSEVDQDRISRLKEIHSWLCAVNIALLAFSTVALTSCYNSYVLGQIVMGSIFTAFAIACIHFPQIKLLRSKSAKILLVMYFIFSITSMLFMITSACILWPIPGIFVRDTGNKKDVGYYMFSISCFLLGIIPTIHSITIMDLLRNASKAASSVQYQKRTRWIVDSRDNKDHPACPMVASTSSDASSYLGHSKVLIELSQTA
ncbi:unnamed protein product [Moneuplotes crassus]|uniref:Uncharacterized protein n=1 Tax=Euplotes crassus TaxID=5936 RepID=A0AAD1XF87_EUPCR|nr:unnamed protein product [Moneuplotes crassus]